MSGFSSAVFVFFIGCTINLGLELTDIYLPPIFYKVFVFLRLDFWMCGKSISLLMECRIQDCGIRNLVKFYIQHWVRLQCSADKGRLPFVKTGQPNWSIHKRNVLVRPNCNHSLRPNWSSILDRVSLQLA